MGERTAMNKEQRNSAFNITPLMHKMHINLSKTINFDLCLEMWKYVQLRFLLLPIETILPVTRQSLDIRSMIS